MVYSIHGSSPTICAGCGVKYWINVVVKKDKKMLDEKENKNIMAQTDRQTDSRSMAHESDE